MTNLSFIYFKWICQQIRLLSAHREGAVLVEFAIMASFVLFINILVYDFASFLRIREQADHATEFIHSVLIHDSDHRVTRSKLEAKVSFLSAVVGQNGFHEKSSLVLIDAIPVYMADQQDWSLVVCWSWSSNPSIALAPEPGSILSPDSYHATLWIPAQGTTSNTALLIAETTFKYEGLAGIPYLPTINTQTMIAPIRSIPGLPLNLFYYDDTNLILQNGSSTNDPDLGYMASCQR